MNVTVGRAQGRALTGSHLAHVLAALESDSELQCSLLILLEKLKQLSVFIYPTQRIFWNSTDMLPA